jgi:hypothetical protein
MTLSSQIVHGNLGWEDMLKRSKRLVTADIKASLWKFIAG